MDGSGFTFKHLLKVFGHIGTVNSYLQYCQDALSIRMKQNHIVNVSWIIRKLHAMVKPFLGKELKESMIFHESPEKLLEYLNPEIIPNEYGGTAGTIEEMHKNAMKTIENNVARLAEYNQLLN